MDRLRWVAAVSGLYDASAGAILLLGRQSFARLFGIPTPHPEIYGDLNGIFLLAVGFGYLIPFRDPERGRAYLWIMGPLLKGAGAAAFLLDHLLRHSPSSLLLFAASDGALALITLWALGASSSTNRPAHQRR
jgi:hypothetical protein